MFTVLNYLRVRYLGQKGQGIVEYALILAFVVAVAAALTNEGTLQKAVSAVFTKATNQLTTTTNTNAQ